MACSWFFSIQFSKCFIPYQFCWAHYRIKPTNFTKSDILFVCCGFPFFLLLDYKWISRNTHSKRQRRKKTTKNIPSDKSTCTLATEKPSMRRRFIFCFCVYFCSRFQCGFTIILEWKSNVSEFLFVVALWFCERRIWTLKH